MNSPIVRTDRRGLDACYWDDGTHDDSPEEGGATEIECGRQGGTWIQTVNTTVTVTALSCWDEMKSTFVSCMTGAGYIDAGILGFCAGACAFTGNPAGWLACMGVCMQAVVELGEVELAGCGVWAVGTYYNCQNAGSAPTQGSGGGSALGGAGGIGGSSDPWTSSWAYGALSLIDPFLAYED